MRQVVAIGVTAVLGAFSSPSAPAIHEPCDPVVWAAEFADLTMEAPWPIGADLNGDWALDAFDVLELVVGFGPCDEPCPGDLDGNDSIDLFDLLILLAEIEPSPLLASARGS
jgi:hypothetical protein